MKKKVLAGLAALALSLDCLAQAVDLPAVKPGDTWTYLNTIEKGATGWSQRRNEISVLRVTSSGIYYTSKQSGSTQPGKDVIAATDWSRVRDVNGSQTVVNKPFSFPLSPGKTWEVQYTEQHPNPAHKFEQWDNKFTVVGFEPIEVPAGKFNALKIEAEGQWTAELEPGQTAVQTMQADQTNTTAITQVKKTTATVTTGRTYKAFWYAPEAKRWVKSVEEYYGNGGVRSERYTDELESFKVAE